MDYLGRANAINKIKDIRDGDGVDRKNYPETMKGSIAKRLWHGADFSYGMEYGYILALMDAFNIKEEDLK